MADRDGLGDLPLFDTEVRPVREFVAQEQRQEDDYQYITRMYSALARQILDLIEDIFTAYDRYCDEQNQVLNAVLTCIQPPTEEQKKGMEAFLCKKYGANRAKIEVRQDKALLGGFILRVGSDEYDWSMKGRLNRLEQRLTWR